MLNQKQMSFFHCHFPIICCNFAPAFEQTSTGEMVEWSITAVLKTAALRGAGGSNPSLSAENT